jgi:hypothetical protein
MIWFIAIGIRGIGVRVVRYGGGDMGLGWEEVEGKVWGDDSP